MPADNKPAPVPSNINCDECGQNVPKGSKYYTFDKVPYNSQKIPDDTPCKLCVKCTATKLYEVYRTMEELMS